MKSQKESINELLILNEFELSGVAYSPYKFLMLALPIVMNAKVIVETGLHRGNSTEIFLRSLHLKESGHLHTIDYEKYPETVDRLKRKELTDRWTFHRKDSIEAGKEWKDEIDLLYLDSLHKKEFVKDELSAWAPNVTGIIAVHDTVKVEGFARSGEPWEAVKDFCTETEWIGVNLTEDHGMALLWRGEKISGR